MARGRKKKVEEPHLDLEASDHLAAPAEVLEEQAVEKSLANKQDMPANVKKIPKKMHKFL